MDPDRTELYIGFALFVLSEAIGLSKMKESTVLQTIITIARRAFPYDVSVQRHDEKRSRNRNRR